MRGSRRSVAAGITGVPAEQIVATARLLWDARPVAFYTWSGLEQHSNATQTVRAIGQLYALTGCIDAPGGNVLFTPVPTNPIDGAELLSPQQRAKAIGVQDRPLGPARFEFITGEDLYRAAIDHVPYRARALVNFGANLVMAHGNSARGRDALAALDFFVHADLFMNPTAEQADIVLPVTSAFESEALRIGFEISQDAQSPVQLRTAAGAARGARPARTCRSSSPWPFGWDWAISSSDGDIEAAWRHQLAPSGITLEQLREHPEGVRVPLQTKHRKYLDARFPHAVGQGRAVLAGLRRRRLPAAADLCRAEHRPALPAGPRRPRSRSSSPARSRCSSARPSTARSPSLRASAPDPQVEVHPETAAARGIAAGDWVRLSHAERQRPRAGEAEREPGPERRRRPARLVAGVPRTRDGRLPTLR